MNAFWLVFFSNALLSRSITVYHKHRDIATKTKIELKPVRIPCGLNDMIKISAPIFTDQSLYYLTNPNGDSTTLNITTPIRFHPKFYNYGVIEFIMMRKRKPYVTMQYGYEVFNLISDDNALKIKESEMNGNDFLLGPLQDEDHGTWVLSAYNMDYNGDWIELFQTINIQIIEFALIEPLSPILKVGSTLHLQLAYPIQALKSCQLVAPQTSYDRLFERSHLEIDKCSFVLRNLTIGDNGVWRIIAVGRIAYEGGTMVTITH